MNIHYALLVIFLVLLFACPGMKEDSSMSAISDKISTLVASVNRAEQRNVELQNQIASLQTQVGTLQGQVSILKSVQDQVPSQDELGQLDELAKRVDSLATPPAAQ